MIIGMGVDLVEIARVEQLVARKGDRALRRLFSTSEIEYAMRRSRPAAHLAARLAAKEAAFKALAGSAEARTIGWKELEVINGHDGQPSMRLHGAAHERMTTLGGTRLWLTITHSATTACAVVVCERG